MIRTLKTLVAVAVTALSIAPAFAGGVTPVGQWQVSTGDARYAISSCGGGICAKLIWLAPKAQTEANLAVLNTYIVKGARPKAANKWSGNVIFEGRQYDGTMTLVSNNAMILKGCSGMLCQTFKLSRI